MKPLPVAAWLRRLLRIAGFASSLCGFPAVGLGDEPSEAGDHVALGPGEYLTPSYPGAHSTRSLPVPFVDAEYGRVYTSAADVLGIYAYKNAAAQVGGAFEYDLTERLAKDDQRFRNLRDVGEATRFKLFATRTLSFVTADANVATDISGHGQGTLALADAWFSLPVGVHLMLSAGPGVTWADARYMHTFFGVTAAQAAVSPLAVYGTREGTVDVHWNGLVTWEISSRWSGGLSGYLAHLHGSADHSPFTSSRRQVTSLGWLAYKIR